MKKITVLGGGTAGWLTALFVKKVFPEAECQVIQSESIGIVGVGEASTPHLVNFLKYLDIDIIDLVKKTNGTIKNGIHFENWNGDNKSYFHNFSENVVDFKLAPLFNSDCYNFHLKNIVNQQLSFRDYTYQTKLAYEKKVDLNKTNWAIHFDSALMAEYLENLGRDRGIHITNGEFLDAIQDDVGNIKKIQLTNSKIIETDFVFDCSGFNRLLIGNLYKQKWISYKSFLPMKKAMSFWLDKTENPEPYTSSIAMKNGWLWKIPLQNRTGVGYIFDSDLITDDDALVEVEQFLNDTVKVRKIISFDPGMFEKVWVKNCMAVGLSSSFIEPLESTSLWLTISQLEIFKHFLHDLHDTPESSLTLFNEILTNNMNEIVNFVYLHYITSRNDSEFWRTFQDKHPPPPAFSNMLTLLKKNDLNHFNFIKSQCTTIFPLSSYLQVAYGLEIIGNDSDISSRYNTFPSTEEYKYMIDGLASTATDHIKFLKSL